MKEKLKFFFAIVVLSVSSSGLDNSSTVHARNFVSSEVLGEIRCIVNGQTKALVLTSEIINPKQKSAAYLRLVIFRLKLYTLKDGQASDQAERTVWQDFSFYAPQVMPQPSWSSALAIDETGTQIYLVLAVSAGTRFLSTVYLINPLNSSKAAIPEFDEKGRILDVSKENKEKPFAEYNKDFALDECRVNRLRLEMGRDNLLIYPERDNEKCSIICLRLNLKTKEWSEVFSQQPPK